MGKLESAPLSLYSLTGPKGVVLIFVPYNHPNLLLISPMVKFHNSSAMPTNPYIFQGWRHRGWERRLHQDFGASSCDEHPSS